MTAAFALAHSLLMGPGAGDQRWFFNPSTTFGCEGEAGLAAGAA